MDPSQRTNIEGLPQESKLLIYKNHRSATPNPPSYSAIAAQTRTRPTLGNGPPLSNMNQRPNMAHIDPPIAPPHSTFIPNPSQNMAPKIHANLTGLTDLGVLPNLSTHLNLPPTGGMPNSMLQATYAIHPEIGRTGIQPHQNLVPHNMGPYEGLGGPPPNLMPQGIPNRTNYGDIGVIPNLGMMHPTYAPANTYQMGEGVRPLMGMHVPNTNMAPATTIRGQVPIHGGLHRSAEDKSLEDALRKLFVGSPSNTKETATAGVSTPFFYPNNDGGYPANNASAHSEAVVSNMSPYAPIYTPNTSYQAEIPTGTTYYAPDGVIADGGQRNNGYSNDATEPTVGTYSGTTYYASSAGIITDAIQRNDGFLETDAAVGHYSDVPENVGMYTDLVPLDPLNAPDLWSSFRVTHRQTTKYSAMRRLYSTAMGNPKVCEQWKNINHPNIVKFHEHQESQAFGDTSTLLFFDYHPGSVTLMKQYISPSHHIFGEGGPYADAFSSDPEAPRPYTQQKNAILRAVASGDLIPEAFLWSLLVQMSSALRAIHKEDLACRNLNPTKVIMIGQRLRISWCGVPDYTQPLRTRDELINAQKEDLRALGHMAMSLAVRTVSWENVNTCFDIISRSYSPTLINILAYLLTQNNVNVNHLSQLIGIERLDEVLITQQIRNDILDEQYALEIDNGRLLRLLIKFGIVNERPELNQDFTWSETGDRYLLKLFRDYLFHTVNPSGHPCIDQGHITYCLNQLDSGTTNKILLSSRDEESILVVSFSELKHCLEQSVNELNNIGGDDNLLSYLGSKLNDSDEAILKKVAFM